jgi:methylase of polypeptide subunit release factors
MIPLYEWKQSPFIFKDASISHNVYEPCTDTYTLIDALYLDKDSILAMHPSRCAEIGVGSGYALIALYEITHCPCIGTDINPDAVSQASKVVDLYSYGHDIHIKQCNILDGIEGMLDVIIINPVMHLLALCANQ